MPTRNVATPGPNPAAARRARPAGWSPGTGTLLGAWVASAAIARLTGATAVILLLAAAIVAMGFEIVAGWWVARGVLVRSVVAPPVADAGELVELLVTVETSTGHRSIDHRRVTCEQLDGTVISTRTSPSQDAPTTAGATAVWLRCEHPGVLTELKVRVDVAGPAGLVWWKRTTTIAIDPLHIAPIARGPLADVESVSSTSDGSVTARRGNHGGEIDGVRPWRQGDSTNSVHWASSLRTDELIVHDRLTATDERWLVDLDGSDPGRLRFTLDEGRRLGHDVVVRTSDGNTHAVPDADAAARWAAIAAQTHLDADARIDPSDRSGERVGFLHRQISLRPAPIETATTITGVARWAAAAAAFASMGMLIGALGGSAALLGLVLVSVVVAAAVSLWVARRGGKRPLVMQVAIVGAIVVALVVIAAQAVDVDGLLAALRGPLPNVLMLLVVLHGFETVDRRTLRVHLAITFVLACYAAGLRIDGALGWWLGAWGVPFVVAMVATSHRPRGGDIVVAAPRRPSVGSVRVTSRWALSIVAMGVATLAVLSLVPVPDGPARLGLPALSANAPTVGSRGGLAAPDGSTSSSSTDDSAPSRGLLGGVAGYPGFTEQLDTSVRGDLGDEIVMRVRAPEPAFWRGQTFTDFDGRTWTVSPELGRERPGPVIDVQPTVGDALGASVPTRELVQTYFIEQDLPNVVFAAGATRPGDLRRIVVDPARRCTAIRRDPDGGIGLHGDLRAGTGGCRDPARAGRPRRVLRRIP